jgi:hypothetical protein
MERDFVKYKTVSGPPVTLDHYTLTPQAKVLTVWLPFGTFTWNRAAAVVVEEAGQIRRYPVIDVTRLAQQALVIGGLLVTVIGLVMTRKTRKETKK